jgi:hypothetical protein
MRRVLILALVNLVLLLDAPAMAAEDPPGPVAENADAIEALFLGSGPLKPTDGSHPCPLTDYWKGFPRGTTVKVRLSTTVSEKVREAIEQALRQVPEATNGAIEATFELTEEPNPMPGPNEVTLTFHPDPVSQGCIFDRGCIIHRFESKDRPGIFRSGRAVQAPDLAVSDYVHDVVGHGVVGMCHIDGGRICGPENSLMSRGPGVFSGETAIELTPLDLSAAKAVFGSKLSPGANRNDFIKHRLIDPKLSDGAGECMDDLLGTSG